MNLAEWSNPTGIARCSASYRRAVHRCSRRSPWPARRAGRSPRAMRDSDQAGCSAHDIASHRRACDASDKSRDHPHARRYTPSQMLSSRSQATRPSSQSRRTRGKRATRPQPERGHVGSSTRSCSLVPVQILVKVSASLCQDSRAHVGAYLATALAHAGTRDSPRAAVSSRMSLAAENLFLRKQLALFDGIPGTTIRIAIRSSSS